MISLPSLHTLDRAQVARIWLATEATDMRCGFDRLAERVRGVIGQDPLSGHYFVFRSRRGDRLKILLWERDGFLLFGILGFRFPCYLFGVDRLALQLFAELQQCLRHLFIGQPICSRSVTPFLISLEFELQP
jgi:hypothetical protein